MSVSASVLGVGVMEFQLCCIVDKIDCHKFAQNAQLVIMMILYCTISHLGFSFSNSKRIRAHDCHVYVLKLAYPQPENRPGGPCSYRPNDEMAIRFVWSKGSASPYKFHQNRSMVVDLSLIHISEPTRPY